jgi:hypothetical protein
LLPHSPPLPIGATFSVGTLVLTVTFNKRLAAGTSAANNWTLLLGNGPAAQYVNPAPAIINGTTVTATMALGGAAPPDLDTCEYRAIPADVLGYRTGLPVAAFTDFPYVKIP